MTLPRLPCASLAAVVLAAHAASAQPAPPAQPAAPAEPSPPPAATVPPDAPLAQIKDDRQIAEVLQSITQDPAIPVDNPATRPLAQALMTEGVRQLRARAFDQALANFLEAYAKFPSPKILLNVASTLHDMGRLADAANTYQRYLSDPATGAERVAEVKDLLIKLDEQLTILTVRVSPKGSEISIDGGPFIPVGSTLVTRVRSGLHLVRIRKDDRGDEVTLNGFEGENKEIAPALSPLVASAVPPAAPPVVNAPAAPPALNAPAAPPAVNTPAAPPALKAPAAPAAPPERVDGWLITGTQYGSSDATGRSRTVRDESGGRELSAIVPHSEGSERVEATADEDDAIDSGVISVLRIDGKGRGFAGGIGLAIARGHFEFDAMALKSDEYGGYLGARYRLFTGVFRPYVALGIPGFAFDHHEMQADGTIQTSTRLAIGVRAAAGLELMINGHFSVQGDLGYEHFFFVDDHFEADVFVPTLGVIGRL
ncbi:MAG TPA: hypothetical protein VHW23_45640 [Kofleriaceae bacterium]|nr:hypothetical protein [Kofleriaceae bacterium]